MMTQTIQSLLVLYVPKVAMALLVLVIGFCLCGRVAKMVKALLSKKEIDPAVGGFLASVLSALLKLIVVISAAQMVGIATTSFVAVLGAMGLAVGMALQGSLANFAGGVLILVFKPFKTGDYISSAGVEGIVQEIQIFQTILLSPDNKKIIIPNGVLSNGTIVNYTAEDKRRVDWSFGIGYSDDIVLAQSVVKKVLQDSQYTLPGTEIFVEVAEHGDSSVNLAARAWTLTENYWNIHFEVLKKVKLAFDENNISIPFPQMDLHMQKS